MEDSHVVDQANVTLVHHGAKLHLLGGEVDCVQSFGLRLVEVWNTLRARIKWRMAHEQAAGEVGDQLAILHVHDRTAKVGRLTTVAMIDDRSACVVHLELKARMMLMRCLRIKRPIGLGQSVDDIRSSGS